MTDFTFRLRLKLSNRTAIEINKTAIDLSDLFPPSLNLASFESKMLLKEAKDLVFFGSGFSSREIALDAGQRVRDALTLAFSKLRIGAYFGERGPTGGFFQAGLAWLESRFGKRVLNDTYGLVAFETNPPASFARLGEPTLSLGTTTERFRSVFSKAIRISSPITDRHRLAYELFSASFFEQAEDARFLFLAMSVEALLDHHSRLPQVVEHVEQLISATLNAINLPTNEMESLIGSLSWLKVESIRQAGIRLAKQRLPGRQYMGLTAEGFFLHCYDLRSRLVHGNQPPPSRAEVGAAAATLEVFVSDLLAGLLLDS